jgi:hypothetical protein
MICPVPGNADGYLTGEDGPVPLVTNEAPATSWRSAPITR